MQVQFGWWQNQKLGAAEQAPSGAFASVSISETMPVQNNLVLTHLQILVQIFLPTLYLQW